MITNKSRRSALKKIASATSLSVVSDSMFNRIAAAETQLDEEKLSGKINHSACRWCYNTIPLEDMCKMGKKLGLVAVDLLEPSEWDMAKKYGLVSSMGFSQPKGFGIMKGFNRIENHATLIPFYEDLIPKAANAGLPNIICFSGNREGLSDEMGVKNCAEGLKKLMKLAEKHKINVVMELLNSKVDHKDYQCDHTAWGVELCKATGSENFKLLYDIYHMQIMEGDIIRNIKEYHSYIAHYHTGGVPGRHEIDDSQELYYPAIMKAIVETGHKGFVAQEFIPIHKSNPASEKPTNEDKWASLKKCVKICDI
jgi:hydroxypyruvate isomerase